MRELCRQTDWASTPLGAVRSWSDTLRTTVRTCLESPFPISLWCGPELVLIYNDAYVDVLGAKHPDALGQPGARVWDEIWPQVAPLFDRIHAGGPPGYTEDAPFTVLRGADAPTGEPNAWFTFALSAVRDARGEIVAFLNIVSETTRRMHAERAMAAARASAERAEARLRDVFAQAPAFLAVLRGPDHTFEYVNDAYYQLVGHRELIGLPALEALPEVRSQGFGDLLDRVIQTGEPYVGRELPIMLTPAPESEPVQRFVDFIYYPLTEPDGTRSGVVAHGSDVTEHVNARAEAQRARAEAEQANLAKSQFLANMSHEIRTPINAVMGYADLLDAAVAGTLTDRQRNFVSRIRESSRHLLGLIDDILDLSKVEAGEMLVRMEETPVRDVTEAALQIIAVQAQEKQLEIREEWSCNDRTQVLGDENRVRQILLNLLSNALKFTPPGGTITVRCETVEAAEPDAAVPDVGPWVLITVEDTGTGISPEHLTRIFDPFVQVEGGHTRRASGTGLGLTISRRFARLMSGDLTARSTPNVGSRFLLWLLPAAQAIRPVAHWKRADAIPTAAHELPALGTLGKLLLAAAERVEEELVGRMRADRLLPSARQVDTAQLADHSAGLLAVMARNLIAIDEGHTEDLLVEDGAAIQDMMTTRHGRQRRRLGWSRDEVEREYRILHDVLDSFLRREGAQRTSADVDSAMGIVHRLLDRAEAASLQAFDDAGTQPDRD